MNIAIHKYHLTIENAKLVSNLQQYNHIRAISVPDKRGVSGQKPEKAGHLT